MLRHLLTIVINSNFILVSAIFQRKGGPAHSNAEAKKLFRMVLMGFLRTAQLEDAHLTECKCLLYFMCGMRLNFFSLYVHREFT